MGGAPDHGTLPMAIKTKTAYKMGIVALKKQRQDFAFDANLYNYGVRSIVTTRHKKKYDRLTEAIEILQKESEK